MTENEIITLERALIILKNNGHHVGACSEGIDPCICGHDTAKVGLREYIDIDKALETNYMCT
jgi:hypothetical protein